MNFKEVRIYIEKLAGKTIIEAKKVHEERFQELKFTTFLKYLERLTKSGFIKNIGKGVYCRIVNTPFGPMGIGDKDIVSYFTGSKRDGVVIGYSLYNKYNLTTQISKTVQVYSNKIEGRSKSVGNVVIKKVPYTASLQFTVEYMEVLENYNSIEDLNRASFFCFCKKIASDYDEKKFSKVYAFGNYKKSTIAFLKYILEKFNIKNNLSAFLNSSSKYAHPLLEELHFA